MRTSHNPRWLLPVALVVLCAFAAAPAPAAQAACPNEQLRAESNVNPATGQPFDMGLPECRAYEMVSPPEKGGSDVTTGNTTGFPVAVDGEAAGFMSQNAFGDAENAVAGGLGLARDSYVARRGAAGWTTSSTLAPRALIPEPAHPLTDASPALNVVAACGLNAVSNSGASNAAVCALRDSGGAWLSTPLYQNLTGSMIKEATGNYTLVYAGGSRDLSHVVFESFDGSRGGAYLASDDSSNGGNGLYEISGLGGGSPKLSLVNVDNSGNEIGPEHATLLGGISFGGSGNGGISYQAISANGSMIYFTAKPAGGVPTVYVRIDEATTVAVSNPSPSQCTTCASTPAPAAFAGASVDGSKAFFETAQQLVNGDTDTSVDLYEYDFEKPGGENVIDLSHGGAGDPSPGSGAEVQGVVRTSSDASHVYFVARGVLTTTPNRLGQSAVPHADNLYAVGTETGDTKFVAELCSNASTSGLVADSQCPATLNGTIFEGTNDTSLWGEERGRAAQTTADGRYLAFTTYAHLMGSGAEAQLGQDEARQVYRYYFDTGQLVRVSIGEPAFSASHNGNTPGLNATIIGVPAEGVAGEQVGGYADVNDWNREISENGAYILFSTPERLQANDVNTGTKPTCGGAEGDTGCDVYVWHECEGGVCEDAMAGEVHMVSPGTDPTSQDTETGTAGMSASGSDIFLFTRTPLVGQDADSLVDVYDARVNGGFPAPTPESSCSGEECQGTASSLPTFGAPGSVSFTGGANLAPPPEEAAKPAAKPKPKPLTRAKKLAKALKACAKRPKRKRAACRRAAHRRYGARKSKGKKRK